MPPPRISSAPISPNGSARRSTCWSNPPRCGNGGSPSVTTFHFIRAGDFTDTLAIAARLLADPQDLIHKATGWMLREVGKRDMAALEGFLRAHYRDMPRTMLRYAIERFPEERRLAYLRGTLT